MAKNTIPATDALNEEDYINKLYDSARDKQKELLKDAYSGSQETLDSEQKRVQQQTDTNVQRTNVEAQKLAEAYEPRNTSDSIDAQVSLAMGNQKRKNTDTLRTAQEEADYEIERQRLLLGQQYAEAIKKAQAENDLVRAQQLYAEAKAKDAEFRAMRANVGNLLAEKGDNSILEELNSGQAAIPGSSGSTSKDVLKNEDAISKIYDAANESNQEEAQMVLNAMLSKLQAKQAETERETDRRLTETYVNALRSGKNYDEVQNAYGLGSGNMAQARLARGLGMTEDLTALRGAQTAADAQLGQQRVGAYQDFRYSVQESEAANEQKKAEALLEAAKGEEQNLANAQMQLAKAMAQQGDYSLLGMLYGLTQDQIDRLQGTGEYAPVEEEVAPEKEPEKEKNPTNVPYPGPTEEPKEEKPDKNAGTKGNAPKEDIWDRGSQYSGVGAVEDRIHVAEERAKEAEVISDVLANDLMAKRGSQYSGTGTVNETKTQNEEAAAAAALASAIAANDLMAKRGSESTNVGAGKETEKEKEEKATAALLSAILANDLMNRRNS